MAVLRPLIKPDDVGLLARPCNADDEIMLPIIQEAMREDVKPRIGDDLFIELTEMPEEHLCEDLQFLLNGGVWDSCGGHRKSLCGLKTALAYYVYARVVRDGNIQSTRFGARIKTDDNSMNAEDDERNRQYRQAFSSADACMAECLAFINEKRGDYNVEHPRVMKSNRTKFRVVG